MAEGPTSGRREAGIPGSGDPWATARCAFWPSCRKDFRGKSAWSLKQTTRRSRQAMHTAVPKAAVSTAGLLPANC